MTEHLESAVGSWLTTRATAELATDGFAQIDLDELLEDRPVLAARAGLSCVELAVALARQSEPDVDGILTIPLPVSGTMVQASPTLHDVLATPWVYGPGQEVPGLYLVRQSVWRVYEPVEEYRSHLDADAELPPGWAAYYRTWCSQADATRGWEYARTIYIRTT